MRGFLYVSKAAIYKFPVSNADNKINNQPVILSGVELLLSEKRGRSARRSRRGISQRILVACQWDVTFPLVSYLNSFGDPFVAIAPRFYLAPRSVKLRLRSG